jgi:RNA-directed DNA polymerase
MKSVSRFIEDELKLRVNNEKSSVTQPDKTQFLGFSFTPSCYGEIRSKVSSKSLKRLRREFVN